MKYLLENLEISVIGIINSDVLTKVVKSIYFDTFLSLDLTTLL